MCFGKNWDQNKRSYVNRRSIDDELAPNMPVEFKQLVKEAIRDSQDFIKQEIVIRDVEKVLPGMSPDTSFVSFYATIAKLGLHQDLSESIQSLRSGLPVVSFSIGHSAKFMYGDVKDVKMANKVVLESGDVLIFGGNSRFIYHGVARIMPNSAPSFLVEEANLRPGRLNLSFRQF